MKIPGWAWLVAALGAAAAGFQRAQAPQGGPGAADSIARAIVVELGSKGTRAEKAGIAYVAINRARGWGASLPAVIRSEVPGRPVWGSRPALYNPLLDRVDPEGSAYRSALAVAEAALAGVEPNPIGRRRAFVHPGFPSYATAGGTRVPANVPGLGVRYLPTWAVSKAEGGKASNEPIDIGTTPTRFA